MPFTPFHFGPAGILSLSMQKKIDVPAFLLANVIIDLEPLFVILSGANYPLHGFVHTLLLGGMTGALLGSVIFFSYPVWLSFMQWIGLNYYRNFQKAVFSGHFGAWFHVFIDSFLYSEMNPLYPFFGNPLYDIVPALYIYYFCGASFIPAILLYFFVSKSTKK